MSRIAVFGAGYVGLVTGACFADLGHDVVVRDVIPERIAALQRGELPIYEPGLDELLARNTDRLRFTMDVGEAIEDADFVYVAVGTPPTLSGDADLSAVWTVVDELPHVDRRIVVVMKSTVPVGTGAKVRHRLDERGMAHVGYVSNPEFTAEGTAVRDFMEPDRVVVGAFDDADGDAVEELHAGIDAPVVRGDVASAEMIKLAANAALMTRISFINEIANVCEATGADVVKVAEGIGLDRRIGTSFLRAGAGFGGSCLVGDETVLVRRADGTRLMTLEQLYDDALPGEHIEVLSWGPNAGAPEFARVDVVTKRRYRADVVHVRTKMGRRLRCTTDHPFVTAEGVKLADELSRTDWLPLATGAAAQRSGGAPRFLDVLGGLAHAGLGWSDVLVRPDRAELGSVSSAEMRAAPSIREHTRGAKARRDDIRRSRTLRLDEALDLDLDLAPATVGTARNGTYVPTTIEADTSFWHMVGLYLAEGHVAIERDAGRRRIAWSFHPTLEHDLVGDVAGYWRRLGVKATVRRAATALTVSLSSRVLAAWWLDVLRLGRTSYDKRIPDAIWERSPHDKRALLAGLWRGDGSWSFVNGGPSVVLEYGTVSRELADGMLRLLGELGVVARMKVGRTAKSTTDTYWLTISGAAQIEGLLDFVRPSDRSIVRRACGRVERRIAPTGYRRAPTAAWVRVVAVDREPYDGYVYSLEVPPTHTVVTTGGLVVHNCFPKDSLALKQLAANSGYHFQLLAAVIEVNELQKRRLIGKLHRHLGSLRGKRVAVLGLAFKPHTDDMREAPSLVLAGRLLAEGAEVRAWDPVATADGLHGVEQVATIEEALAGADAAVLVTEWPQLADVDWAAAARTMRSAILVDGRNMLDPAALRAAGFAYEGVGRNGSA